MFKVFGGVVFTTGKQPIEYKQSKWLNWEFLAKNFVLKTKYKIWVVPTPQNWKKFSPQTLHTTQFYFVILIIIVLRLKLGKNIVKFVYSPLDHNCD